MKNTFLAILLTLSMCAGIAFAAEEESAEKKKPAPKASAGAAIDSVLLLPVVSGWKQSVAAQGGGVSLVVWGEDIEKVNDQDCWGINVGKDNGDRTRLWKRFCVAKDGSAIWVENTPSDTTDEITYFTYDEWVSKCHPTNSSLGSC